MQRQKFNCQLHLETKSPHSHRIKGSQHNRNLHTGTLLEAKYPLSTKIHKWPSSNVLQLKFAPPVLLYTCSPNLLITLNLVKQARWIWGITTYGLLASQLAPFQSINIPLLQTLMFWVWAFWITWHSIFGSVTWSLPFRLYLTSYYQCWTYLLYFLRIRECKL